MAFWEQPQAWYFHDLWKRTASTWGGGPGFTWTRVDLPNGGGPRLDYPEMVKHENQANVINIRSRGWSGIGRRWRWNGKAWQLEETRYTEGDVGNLEGPASTWDTSLAAAAPIIALAIVFDIATGAKWTSRLLG